MDKLTELVSAKSAMSAEWIQPSASISEGIGIGNYSGAVEMCKICHELPSTSCNQLLQRDQEK